MSFKSKFAESWLNARSQARSALPDAAIEPDPELAQTLELFRRSVNAWSDAAFQRPRASLPAVRHRMLWRRAVAWAFGLVLLAGGLSAGFYHHHHEQQLARLAAQQKAAQQKLLAEKKARDLDEMLAKVDSDVSREVPSAMEPLADLMNMDDSR